MDYTDKRPSKAFPDGERNTDAILIDIHSVLLDVVAELKKLNAK
jgi:hypothetical protein